MPIRPDDHIAAIVPMHDGAVKDIYRKMMKMESPMTRGPSKRGPELGPIGDKVLFENEYLRVWSVQLDPGERQSWHQHHLPYLIVPMTAGKNIMYYEDGREKETNETTGEVLWREAGIPHELLNISDWQYRNVLIEIKAVPGAAR